MRCSCTFEAGDSDCAAHPMCPECAADLSDTQLYKQATADDNREPLVQEVISAWADYYDGDFGPPHGKEELLGALKALAEWKP